MLNSSHNRSQDNNVPFRYRCQQRFQSFRGQWSCHASVSSQQRASHWEGPLSWLCGASWWDPSGGAWDRAGSGGGHGRAQAKRFDIEHCFYTFRNGICITYFNELEKQIFSQYYAFFKVNGTNIHPRCSCPEVCQARLRGKRKCGRYASSWGPQPLGGR